MDVHVAQINIGTMIAPTDDPAVSEFMNNLERINDQADHASGFVWRLQTEVGNATSIQIFANPLQLVNMSVWESVEALKAYVYRTEHADFFRRRAEWFESDVKRVALWTIPAGTIPTLDEAVRRADFLDRHGASPYAFGFGRPPAPLIFEVTTPDHFETLKLILRLNDELESAATEPNENHFSFDANEVICDSGTMLRVRFDGALVGCGAVRRIEPTIGEIKRMFVDRSARGNKIGAAILDQLELHATQRGITELKLETDPRQIEAKALYENVGFTRCPAWGEYLQSPKTSLCYSKSLS
jgi:GNAT superfamily N-acetyltransferase